MIAAHRMADRKSAWPRAKHPVFVDSGAFTALTNHGCWVMEPAEYVDLVLRLQQELGIRYAAIQDWLVAPRALAATGLSMLEHQRRTIASLEQLRAAAPGVPWVPVLHGIEPGDYLTHLRMYAAAGFDLQLEPLVGVGSVAYRQADPVLAEIVVPLAVDHGLPCHIFGGKTQGLARVGAVAAAADSMAWSDAGRRDTQKTIEVAGQLVIAGSEHHLCELRDSKGRRLANSPEHAEAFRDRMNSIIRDAKAPALERAQARFEWNAA